MSKTKGRRALLVCAVCMLAALGLCMARGGVRLDSHAVTNGDDLFVAREGMTVQRDFALPESFDGHDGNPAPRTFDLDKKGVLLSSSRMGSHAEIGTQFSGDFTVTFRAYSQMSYYPETTNDFNRHDIVMTPYADLREMYFKFTDSANRTFTVFIAAGEKWNVITPAARVALGDVFIGYHYLNDAKVPNDTGLQNSSGYYTRIGGTTFCNVTRRGGKYSSEEGAAQSMPVTLGFDREQMQIYVMHYGITNVNAGERRLVLDLDAQDTGLRKITAFDDYTVEVGYSDIASGKTANVVFYEINGQSLAGESFVNAVGPQTIVTPTYNAVVGEKYALPSAKTFDLIDGKAAFRGTVSVKKDGASQPLYLADGTLLSDGNFAEGCYFTPASEGNYTISYTATDAQGQSGAEKVLTVRALPSPVPASYTFEGNNRALDGGELGTGSTITAYAATVTSDYFYDGRAEHAQVTLYKDGAQVRTETADKDVQIDLSESGSYVLSYSVKNGADVCARHEYAFTVTDTKPAYHFSTVPDGVSVGSDYTLPAVTASYRSQQPKRATVNLFDPEGKRVTVTGGKAPIDVVGEYRLQTFVKFDNETFTDSFYFDAYHTNDGVFVSDSPLVRASLGDSGNLYSDKKNGVVLSFSANNASATYTREINLNGMTKNDPLIKAMVLPSQKGKLDFWQYTITLTDKYNEKNAVLITVFKGSWGNEFSYVRAGSTDQVLSGWEKGVVLTAYNTGCPINYSFTGESLLGTEEITLYYDYDEKAVYVDNIKRTGYAYGNQVIDLDSTACYPETMLFGGFTTGEVILSVSAQYLQGESASLMITEINGVGFGSERVTDVTPPVFTVDYGEYGAGALPDALVGTAYPIFDAAAFDAVEGKVAHDVRVYKDYQVAAQTEIAVADGKFTPTSAGEYTIVYGATDRSGNRGTAQVRVRAYDELPAFAYTFRQPLKTSYSAGERFALGAGTASGGSGNVQTAIALFDANGDELPLDCTFVKAGAYRLAITFTDFLGRTETQDTPITVTVSDAPVLFDVFVHDVMLAGYTYVLPEAEAVDYSSGVAGEVTKSIKVTSQAGTVTLGADRAYKPTIDGEKEEITVTYLATNAGGKSTEKSYAVTVLNTVTEAGDRPKIDMGRYFAQDGIDGYTKTSNYVEYTTHTEGASLRFANKLIANNLVVQLYVPQAKNNFGAVAITYTDSLDPSIQATVRIVKGAADADTSTFVVGNARCAIAGNFYDAISTGFTLNFNNTSCSFVDQGAQNAATLEKLRFTDEGEPFAGFPSGKVYLSIAFENVTGESAIRVMSIGNQRFSSSTADNVVPQLQLTSFIAGAGDIDKPFTVPAAIVADVLNPEYTLSVKISRDKECVYEGNIETDYTFVPDAYGIYTVSYTVSAGGRTRSISYLVSIKDKISPVLTIDGTVPTEGRVGATVSLPTATVTDNHAQTMRLWIFVTRPDGKQFALEEGVCTFTAEQKGDYTVTYYVEDDYGNYAYRKFTVGIK